MKRKSGILMPITSLPSHYGIGSFSKEAYEFVDFLKEAGQTYWQILPLGQTGYGDSPYQSFSTFAGNPYFIDLERFVEAGYLGKKDLDELDWGTDPGRVDYEKIYRNRFLVLKKAYKNSPFALGKTEFTDQERQAKADFENFTKQQAEWLPDYALYSAIKNEFHGKGLAEWEEDVRLRKPEVLDYYREKLADEIRFYEFQQYFFRKQWMALKKYANRQKIKIIGDIPIYVAFDSADTWAHPELFQLDEKGFPTAVAGCPPDGFSATGQLWGNPLYRWDYHRETGYEWWMKRLAACFELYDVVRIDHFRGFDEYFAIPYGDTTAERGCWQPGPGYDMMKAIKKQLGNKPIIAEDLGFLTPSVLKLVKKSGYPGMKVMQFAFDSREEGDYLPHNYPHNCVVYTGTHDNDTIVGWYEKVAKADLKHAKEYLNIHTTKELNWTFIRHTLASVADTAIIPIQDYLGLGSEARINTPSTLGRNWQWRLLPGQVNGPLAKRILEVTQLYGRI